MARPKSYRYKFPPKHKFKKLKEKQRRSKLNNILDIIENSSSVKEAKQKIENVSYRDINKIERRTFQQSRSSDWYYYRKGIITSTLTKRIDTFFNTGHLSIERINEAITKRKQTTLNYPAIVYGRESEPLAIADFFSQFKKSHPCAKLTKVGLKLHKDLKFFGGSADALVSYKHQNCTKTFVLEIKAPYRLKDKSIVKNWGILEYLTKDGSLKRNHPHFYQLQCYLGLFNLPSAYFVIWSKVDFLSISVDFDKDFYDNICQNVKTYYFKHYLPVIVN